MSVTDAAFSVREAFSAADAAIVEEIGIEDLAELLNVDAGELETAMFGLGGKKQPGKKQSGGFVKRLQGALGLVSQKGVKEQIAKITADIAAVDLKMAPLQAERESLERMLVGWQAKLK